MGRNMMPEWTLENGNTLFLASRSEGHEQPVTATFVCPIEGADISVSPGCSYIFSSYFGLHRTTGTIRLEFRSSEGEVVKVFETAIPKGLGVGSYLATSIANWPLRRRKTEQRSAFKSLKALLRREKKTAFSFSHARRSSMEQQGSATNISCIICLKSSQLPHLQQRMQPSYARISGARSST